MERVHAEGAGKGAEGAEKSTASGKIPRLKAEAWGTRPRGWKGFTQRARRKARRARRSRRHPEKSPGLKPKPGAPE
jgi:hypothetical protein